MIIPVILSGGTGSRLWPLSRELYPKQLLPLVNDQTMLQNTVLRTKGQEDVAEPIIVCNEEHRFMVAEQLRSISATPKAILLEPVGRNTAPAVAVAALHALVDANDPLLLILPSDHVIQNFACFHKAVAEGAELARNGMLVTFGIVPNAPESGYGYIKAGEALRVKGVAAGAFKVEQFVEKPDQATAEQYLASGDYYWNSGMFLFSANSYLQELEQCAPEMVRACRMSIELAKSDQDFVRLDKSAFASCLSDSIDYAVMEKTDKAVVIPLDTGWNDVGAWSALWEIGEKDKDGNVVRGDVIAHDSHGCYFQSNNRLVTAVGLEDHVIVETADAVLVAPKNRVQDVKSIVNQLNAQGRSESVIHRKVYRPWGAYQSVDNAERFQVKRITVNPGATLSLQMHHHRAEHWIVVKGTACITKGAETIMLSENQSVYIPLGVTHRLENPGVIPLELIEVQSGSYLGEDDIVRFEDHYGRT
ncbi:mannose-1-phosphate guanylyltransferase/mannose-6-phosphate isomerase [Geobacter sp. SVR]|uniref:mannose-1-phosphate guanylyltransferase/mannose-6-phosphate isomerase n=1 Tax=Geobacter sp. SVR TaxID=2495594 RepID=UPI00143F0517|nr:mannose-1-phosphate guanylyltransferase/mannose-6-phosphate isomerase [Geobacter sp. SVR]BCS55022.1 xanthan biosynthesis protein XanB [Geobacter sp. SVR]GCF85203.1 xanthan biosynthesis protein XanB [Geobacter sp. SVR]